MRGIRDLTLVFMLAGCAGSAPFSGVVSDGMSSEPLAGIRILAKASPPSSDLTCQVRETKTGPDGKYTFSDLCGGEQYLISTPEASLYLAGVNAVVAGEPQTAPTEHQAWRAPSGTGVYLMTDDQISTIPTFSDIAVEETRAGEKVRYPSMKPTGRVITIAEGQHLLLAGRRNIQNIEIFPLVPFEGRRQFKGTSIIDHVYIGVSWASGSFERVEAKLDAAKTKDVLVGTKGLRYIAHDAVPAGRYAVLGKDDERVMIIDFGESQAPAKK